MERTFTRAWNGASCAASQFTSLRVMVLEPSAARGPTTTRALTGLCLGGGEQEIALVARAVGGGMQLRAAGPFHPAHIMAGRQRLRAKFARRVQQVGELDPLIAAYAGDRGFAAGVSVGEILDHLF